MEDADRILGGLDGDAAGGTDRQELAGLIAGKEQVGLAVSGGGHVLGRKTHIPSFWTSECERQAEKRLGWRGRIPLKQ
jgi:hypothetical protein